ncbi:hypothetical protein [Acidithiobacillus ferriphilus]|uniref:hypothetical protein n=1 Tax=Acidithiobacillus ferriphilus TaxID=1689834 RepID=UPI002DBD807F|nr:hypothetical protein [Acidithiobacillus ferriphilus]MEB8474025.1 hypothetical protein [Acidithiobacillus ferriphilus]
MASLIPQTQLQMFWAAHRRVADANIAFMEMVTCKENPLTRRDLEALIRRNPERYSRFAHWLDKLPD